MAQKSSDLIHMPYNRFKIWLKDKRITYTDLGKLLGCTPTTIMLKINGQSDFLLSEANKIKHSYHLTDDIFSTEKVA